MNNTTKCGRIDGWTGLWMDIWILDCVLRLIAIKGTVLFRADV